VHKTADGSHQTVSANTALKGLSRRTYEGKGCHRSPKHAHEQEERADAVTSDEIILTGTSKKATAVEAKRQKQAEIANNDD
jgi:phosphoribosyl 1,2-cyclic phosphodiesterase